ncbi:MAG: hypothetical protein ABL931_22070 [Usitatibacteraceae bacterium]
MQRRNFIQRLTLAFGVGLLPAIGANAQSEKPKRKPDLGDVAEGKYFGEVISDSKGSSKAEVTLTVTRIGVNMVRITSDYARLPIIEVKLTKAMDKIVHASGATAFVLDRAKSPARLDVSFLNEVSWAGDKQ